MDVRPLWRSRFAALAFAVVPLVRTAAPPVEVTTRDVEASNEKIASAYSALATMWTRNFQQIGERFAVPRIARYESAIYTPCGVIQPDNAEYCHRNNTIYYDDVFTAGMAKRAARALNTDGDMAAIGIIAHETGHAVALQLGHAYRRSYDNESVADCLAGAFAKQAERDGELESGDVDEALFGMAMAGDPTPGLTGNVHYDRMIKRRLASESHGTREQRMQNFRTGYGGGPGACVEDFRGR